MHEDRVRAVWTTELDRLELDVIRVERLLTGLTALPTDPWDPPAVPGEMPADLALRAQDLLDRQERAITALGTALTTAQQQLAFTDRVHRTRPGSSSPSPIYLDLHA